MNLKDFFSGSVKKLSETIKDKELKKSVQDLEANFERALAELEAEREAHLETKSALEAQEKAGESLIKEIEALKLVNASEAEEKPEIKKLSDKEREFTVTIDKKKGNYRVGNVPALWVGGDKVPVEKFMKDKDLQEKAVKAQHILIKKLS